MTYVTSFARDAPRKLHGRATARVTLRLLIIVWQCMCHQTWTWYAGDGCCRVVCGVQGPVGVLWFAVQPGTWQEVNESKQAVQRRRVVRPLTHTVRASGNGRIQNAVSGVKV